MALVSSRLASAVGMIEEALVEAQTAEEVSGAAAEEVEAEEELAALELALNVEKRAT